MGAVLAALGGGGAAAGGTAAAGGAGAAGAGAAGAGAAGAGAAAGGMSLGQIFSTLQNLDSLGGRGSQMTPQQMLEEERRRRMQAQSQPTGIVQNGPEYQAFVKALMGGK